MSTARCRSALASTCTSLVLFLGLATSAAAGGPSTAGVDGVVLARELDLARQPQVYLVLDPSAAKLDVRSRGLTLESILLQRVDVLDWAPLLGGGDGPSLETPAVWTITEAPIEGWRRLVAPPTLRPYSAEEEEQEGPAPTPGPTATPALIPTEFTVTVDAGWRLEVATRPRGGLASRVLGAWRNGIARVLGAGEADTVPRIALIAAPEVARRLHHLFRPDLVVLVLPPG